MWLPGVAALGDEDRVGLANTKMTEITWRNLQRVGAPAFGDDARAFARQIQQNLGIAPMDNPFIDDNERLTPPEELETRQRAACRPDSFISARIDLWTTPGMRRR